MKTISALLLLLAMAAGTIAGPVLKAPSLVADTVKVKPHGLARISADGVDPKAALVWRISPSAGVSRATTAKGLLEFAAPPGVYEVELLVITADKDGALSTQEFNVSVEFEGCGGPVPPLPSPPPVIPPKGKSGVLDAPQALGKISFPPYGCTATVIGPRRADGKWDVLSAAHCVAHVKVGSKGAMKMLNGRTHAITVNFVDPLCDVSWLTTDDPAVDDMPYANIAADNPPVGTAIWHAGYGVDKPGNREDGKVTGVENPDGQLNMQISVSSGDSGGGIFRADTNELISCVCCTTAKGRLASVWGCSANKARDKRPKTAQMFEWNPIEIPLLKTLQP